MVIGNKSIFAIESGITQAYERLGLRALGYFVLHVGGMCYGVREPDATMLACAFSEAERIIINRGKHTTPFASEPNADEIVKAIRKAIYGPSLTTGRICGISAQEFIGSVYSSHCAWHWACDEAFDDGSSIWHFDIRNRVRLITVRAAAMKPENKSPQENVRDCWIEADEFYSVIERWCKAFEAEWKGSMKVSEIDDGADNQCTSHAEPYRNQLKPSLFTFQKSGEMPIADKGTIVHIPGGVREKRDLLRLIASLLKFPEYFGGNWDALDECLGDLSWLKTPSVCICHEDIPLASNPEEARLYLQVLEGVIREPSTIPLRIVFPESSKGEIDSLLG